VADESDPRRSTPGEWSWQTATATPPQLTPTGEENPGEGNQSATSGDGNGARGGKPRERINQSATSGDGKGAQGGKPRERNDSTFILDSDDEGGHVTSQSVTGSMTSGGEEIEMRIGQTPNPPNPVPDSKEQVISYSRFKHKWTRGCCYNLEF